MAKIWLSRDGSNPTSEAPLAETVLTHCQKLGVQPNHYLGDLAKTPRFGEANDPLAAIRDYQHVIVEIGEAEAKSHGWKPGFYRAPITPEQANKAFKSS